MSANDQLLARLAKLQPDDRAWIVSRLSARQRGALMDLAQSEASAQPATTAPPVANVVVPREPAAVFTPEQALRHAQASEMATILAAEPAWLIRGVLELESWAWSEAFLDLLPAATRASVMATTARAPTRAVREALLRHCAERLRSVHLEDRASSKPTLSERFGRMLVARRLALRS